MNNLEPNLSPGTGCVSAVGGKNCHPKGAPSHPTSGCKLPLWDTSTKEEITPGVTGLNEKNGLENQLGGTVATFTSSNKKVFILQVRGHALGHCGKLQQIRESANSRGGGRGERGWICSWGTSSVQAKQPLPG